MRDFGQRCAGHGVRHPGYTIEGLPTFIGEHGDIVWRCLNGN
jgi:hypothetical protein